MTDESKNLLRVQSVSIADIQLENQNGPIHRYLLELWVSDLFPQTNQEEAKLIRLIFDSNQLAHLKEHLQSLDLPPPQGSERFFQA